MCSPGVEFIAGEVSDRLHLERIFTTAQAGKEPSGGVLHFAALIEAGESVKRPEIYLRNNAGSTLSLLEACSLGDPNGWSFPPRPQSTASRKPFRFKKMRA